MIRAPHISEKSARAQEHNQYVFEVAADADKRLVKDAVEALFNVKVKSVNIVNVKGKVKSFRSAPVRATAGARPMCVCTKARPSTLRPSL